jgi:hypothetical protein
MMTYRVNILYFFFFISFVVIGVVVHDDFGATWDEFRNRKYAQEVVKTGAKTKYNEVLGDHGYIHDGDSHAASRGPLYLIVLNNLEQLITKNDLYHNFKFRRLFNHMFFVFTGIFFFIFLRKIFQDQKVVIISTLMYFLSPRIYAHSFFNPIDIPFLCFFLMFLISFYKLINKPTPKHLVIHALLCGVVTSLRTVGEISILVSLLFLVVEVIKNRYNNIPYKKNLKNVFIFLVLALIAYVGSTPYLWDSPWRSFLEMHHQSANFGEHVPMPTLYWGKVYQSLNLPWHYTITWLLISIPTVYIAVICIAFFKNLITLKSLFKNDNKYQLYLFMIFSAVLFSACFFKYSKYNDWRHFYFLYPLMILLSAFLVDSIKHKGTKVFIFLCFIIQFTFTAYDMYKYHPYQMTYFNRISGGIARAEGNFPLDYFGSSFKQAIFKILEYERNESNKTIPVKVSFYPMPPGWYNTLTLEKKYRDKIEFVHSWEEADYLATKWVFKPYNSRLLNQKKYLFDQIKIDGVSIHNIYKLKGKQ